MRTFGLKGSGGLLIKLSILYGIPSVRICCRLTLADIAMVTSPCLAALLIQQPSLLKLTWLITQDYELPILSTHELSIMQHCGHC